MTTTIWPANAAERSERADVDAIFLREVFGHLFREAGGLRLEVPYLTDSDGAVRLRCDDAPVRYMVIDGHSGKLLVVQAGLLENVSESPDLLRELNRINEGIVTARVFWADTKVIVQADALAGAVTVEDVDHLLWSVGTLAAWAAVELHEEFGGDLHHDDDAPQIPTSLPDWI